MNEKYTISGDSDEYWFLTEAVELSAHLPHPCVEIGLRRGMGTKTIIDAVRWFCPEKTVISIDPYGNIPYIGREKDGYVHLDYTNQMKAETQAALWAYIAENPVDYHFYCWTDTEFFKRIYDFVPVYTGNFSIMGYTEYSMCHLDGPHTVVDVKAELDYFIPRMPVGGIIVFDDITPDFYDHSQIEAYIADQFEIIKTGGKKQIVRKVK